MGTDADVRLRVGFDFGKDYSQARADLDSAIKSIEASHPTVKLKINFESDEVTKVTKAIKGLRAEIEDVKLNGISTKPLDDVRDAAEDASDAIKKLGDESKRAGSTSGAGGIDKTVSEMKIRVSELNKINTSISKSYQKIYGSLSNSGTEESAKSIDNLREKYIALQTAMQSIRDKTKSDPTSITDNEINNVISLQNELNSLIRSEKERLEIERQVARETKKTSQAKSESTSKSISETKKQIEYISKIDKLITSSKSNLSKWTAAKNMPEYSSMKGAISGLENLNKLSASGKVDAKYIADEYNKLNGIIVNSSKAIKAAGKDTQSFGDKWKNVFERLGTWMSVSQVITKAYNAVRKMIEYTTELDTAMVELKKVTNETSEAYERFMQGSVTRAKTLGASVSDVINASADFARLGYSLDEASSLADAAIVYKNVGDGIESVGDASESIISSMKAFKIEATDAITIVDMFNEVGNNFAISSEGVGTALLNSASALATANNTIEESIGLITAANSVVQDPSKVGTALKTISMYLRAAKTEAEEAGESTEGMATSVSKLRDDLFSLTGGKLDIQLDENNFKSTYQTMKELSDVWEDLSDISKANIIEKIGGKRNANVVTSLLENFNVAEEAMNTASNSAGSALAENEKHLDSIEGKASQLKATIESVSNGIITSDLAKSVLDVLINVLNIIDKIANSSAKIPAIIGLIAAALSFKNVGFFTFDKESNKTINNLKKIKELITDVKGANVGKVGLSLDSSVKDSIEEDQRLLKEFLDLYRETGDLSGSKENKLKSASIYAKDYVDSTNPEDLNIDEYVKLRNKAIVSDAAQSKSLSSLNEIIGEYNKYADASAQKMTSLGLTQDEYIGAVGESNKALSNYLKSLNGGSGSLKGYISKLISAKMATIGLEIATAALNTLVSIGISTAISLAIGLVDKLIVTSDELREKVSEVTDTYEEQKSKVTDAGKTIDNLTESYDRLSKGVDTSTNKNIDLPTDKYEEYLAVVNDIAETFPDLVTGYDAQGNAILSLNGNITLLTEAYKELQKSANGTMISSAKDTFKDFKNQKNKILNQNTGFDALFNAGISYDAFKKLEQIANGSDIDGLIEELLGNDDASAVMIARELRNAGIQQDYSLSTNEFIAKAIRENRNIVSSIINDYNSQLDEATGGMKSLSEAYASSILLEDDTISDRYRSIINSTISGLDFDFFKDIESEADLKNKIQEMIDDLKNLSAEDQGAIELAFEAKTKLNNGEISVSEYLKQVEKISDIDLPEEVKSTIVASLDINDMQEKVDAMTNGKSSDIVSWINGLSKSDFDIVYKIWADDNDAKYTLQEWQSLLEREKVISFSLDIDSVTEQISNLDAAIAESISGTGATQEAIDNIKSMFGKMDDFDAGKVFEKTALGVRINTKAVKELEKAYEEENKDALNNKLKALEEQYLDLTTEIRGCSEAESEHRTELELERQEVLNNIQATNVQIAQYDALTSAYNKWQSAKSGEKDQGIYEEIIQGRKDVDDLLSRGWIDEEVKAFVNLISKEDLATASAEEVLDAYSKLNTKIYKSGYKVWDFFTTDEDGNSTSKGVYNFFDTVRKELGETYAWIDKNGNYQFNFSANGMTDEEIANKLGINIEALQAILKAAVGAGFEIDFESISGDMESVLTQAESYAKRLEEITGKKLNFNFATTDGKSLDNQIADAKELLGSFAKDGKIDIDTEGVKEAQFILQTLVAEKIALEKPAVLDVDVNSVDKESQEAFKNVQKYWKAYSSYEQKISVAVDEASKKEAKDEIVNYIKSMNQLGDLGIELSANPDEEEIEKALQKINEYINGTEFATKFGIDQNSIDESAAKVKQSVETIIDSIPPLKIDFDFSSAGKIGEWLKAIFGDSITLDVNADTSDAENGLDNVADKEDKVARDIVFDVNAETQKANKSLQNIQGLIKNISKGASFSVNAETSSAQTKVTNLSTSLNNINGKTYTTNVVNNVTTNKINKTTNLSYDPSIGDYKYAADGTAWANGTAFAHGDWRTKDSGTALVGELGQELVVRNGRFFTIGDDSAEFFRYKKGDIIFNADQTREILENGKITRSRRRGHRALLEGTAFSGSSGSGLNYNKVTGASGGSNKSNGSSSSSSSSSSKSSSSSSSNDSEDSTQKIDFIEIAISRLERAISNLARTADSSFHTTTARLNAIAGEMSKVTDEIKLQNNAYNKYMQLANQVSISDSIKAKVRNGSLDITEYDSDLAEKISEYQELYEKALAAKDKVDELNESLAELYKNKFDIIATNYENKLSLVEHLDTTYNNGISLLEARGQLASTKFYAALKKSTSDKKSKLNAELSDLQTSLDDAVDSGAIKEYSEAWYEMQVSINGVKEEIQEADIALAEYDKQMRQIDWDAFDRTRDSVSKLVDESEFLIDVLSYSDLYDKNGNITDNGKSVLGLRAMNYDTYMAQADSYAKEIKEINKEIAKDPNNTELIDRKNDLIAAQQESILNAYKEKDAIKDLVQEGIQAELSSLKDLIDEYEDALDSAKDLYDYQKKVADQTSKIATLRKQLSAYENDTSEETKAKVQKLKVELVDAENDLKETEYEHYISEQKSLLSSLYDDYESILNERLDNTDDLLKQIVNNTNKEASTINDTLNDESKDVGYTISEEMSDIWSNESGASKGIVNTYGKNSTKADTSTNNVIKGIEKEVQNMSKNSDKEAEKIIKDTTKTSTSATKTDNSNKSSTSTNNSTAKTNKTNTAKAITVGGRINAGSAKIYTSCYGEGKQNQYFKSDPVYTVLEERNGYLKVRHHSKTSGVSGWFKKSDVKAYKKGGLVDYTGLMWADGTKGSPESMLDAKDTENLIQLRDYLRELSQRNIGASRTGNSTLTSAVDSISDNADKISSIVDNRGSEGSGIRDLSVNIEIERVDDYNDFVNQLRNDRQFEKMLQSMTLDRAVGKNSLSKNKYKW